MLADQVLQSAASGYLTGVVSGGGKNVADLVTSKAYNDMGENKHSAEEKKGFAATDNTSVDKKIVEDVAKTVKQTSFASRSGMAAQSVLNKIEAGEEPTDSEINELVYAAINDKALVERAINHGLSQNKDSRAFAVASRLEKQFAMDKAVSTKDFKELMLSEFSTDYEIDTEEFNSLDFSDDVNKDDLSNNRISVKTSLASSVLKNLNRARLLFVDYYKKNFPKSVINLKTEKRIDISRKGIDKFLSGNISKEKFSSGYVIPQLIETAQLVASTPYKKEKGKENIRGYDYYENEMTIDGNPYRVHIRVRNTDMGDKYYGHTISAVVDEIKIEPLARSFDANASIHPVYAAGSINSIIDSGEIVNTQNSENYTKYTEEARINFERTARNVKSIKDGYGRYTKEQILALKRVADAFGVDIFVGDDENFAADGYYVRSHSGERAKIYLNAGGTNPINAVIRHEVIHHIKATSIDAFNTFSNYVTERYIELYGEEAFEEVLSEISETYKTKTGKDLTRAECTDEFCADVGMDMFQNPSEAKRLANTNKNVLQILLDAIQKVLRKIEGLFTNKWDNALKSLSALESTATASEDGAVYHSHNTASESFMPLDLDSLKEAERVLREVLKANDGSAFLLNSKNNIENAKEKYYNNNISFLAGKRKAFRSKHNWHTGLTHNQVSKVEEWVKSAGAPDSNRIVGNAYWYTGRLDGSDLFVIYSNEDKDPTVLYLARGQKAKDELTELKDVLEEIRNVRKSSYVSWVSISGWMQRQNDTENSFANKRRTNNTNAGVLQGQPQGVASRTLRTLLDNLFRDRGNLNTEESDKQIDLSVTNKSVDSTSRGATESLLSAGENNISKRENEAVAKDNYDVEFAKNNLKQANALRKKIDKIKSKTALTKRDEVFIDLVVNGELNLSDLPQINIHPQVVFHFRAKP